ncbi:MAG: ammonium transporter [Salinibacterium sp.]|nr:ammonium transporter [Salinibacterium sp.]
MNNWIVVTASVTAILVVLVSLAVVDARMLPAAPWRRSVLLSLGCAAAGVVAWVVLAPWLAPEVQDDLFLPIAALAGVAAYLATIAVRAAGGAIVATLVFALAWSGLVFVPTAILTFAPYAASWPISIQPIDHGGSLAVNVSAGAAALGVLLLGGPRLRTASIGRMTGLVAMVGLCLGWLAWLVGAELAIDDVTPSILLNGLVGATGGVVGWLFIQRLSHRSTTLNAVAGGLVSGLVAVTAGAPLFTPVSAAAAGILAGGAACIVTLRRVGATRRQQWFVVGSHLVAASVGIVVLGLLGTGMGFLFTGSLSLILNQVVGTVLVALYSTLISVGLWLVLRFVMALVGRRFAAT